MSLRIPETQASGRTNWRRQSRVDRPGRSSASARIGRGLRPRPCRRGAYPFLPRRLRKRTSSNGGRAG